MQDWWGTPMGEFNILSVPGGGVCSSHVGWLVPVYLISDFTEEKQRSLESSLDHEEPICIRIWFPVHVGKNK